MRVLMLSWEYPPHIVGGLGRHVADLLPSLATQGVEVHLLTPRWAGGKSEEKRGKATIHRIDPPAVEGGSLFATAWQTNMALEEHAVPLQERKPFDIIHTHDWLVGFAGCSLKRRYKIPLVATIHATERGRGHGLHNDLQRAINDVEWWLTYEAWRVICASEFMAQEVKGFFNVPADKVDVVPNGVDGERFRRLEGEDLTAFRAQFASPQEKIILHVGRIVHEKGLHLLVQAAPQVLAQHKARFVVVGMGDLLNSLRQQAQELGVGHAFHFTGFIPDEDRDRLYKVADCAVFPSLYEPFGIVALEAMAARVPVVVSEVGGLKEVVKHGETGITIYPNNPDSLAWGILHTLEHPEWAEMRVENAYRMVKEEYGWDRIARQTIEIYQRVVEEREASDW
ncbi:MAG: glycosyltransferase family 4 protein [Anaerolineae bacterium]